MAEQDTGLFRNCAFVTDIHGSRNRYESLMHSIRAKQPGVLFMGGDLLLPGQLSESPAGAITDIEEIIEAFEALRTELREAYPRVFLILGNDDTKAPEGAVVDAEATGLWTYLSSRKVELKDYTLFGYSYINPSPFLWKDWEKYDVSRYVDPACVSPEEGYRSVEIPPHEIRYSTIEKDLEEITGPADLAKSIFLFHAPPYQTNLDRADLDGRMVDHVPLDVNIGSIAIRRLIESRQPLLTLHGHVHESTRLTGSWKDRIGRTRMFNGAHDGPELSVIWFDPDNPANASRELV